MLFEGSRLLPKDEQVYVFKECTPAISIGKSAIDGGHLFVLDPPYLVLKADVHRCKLRMPRSASINAAKFEEQLHPRVASANAALKRKDFAQKPSPKST